MVPTSSKGPVPNAVSRVVQKLRQRIDGRLIVVLLILVKLVIEVAVCTYEWRRISAVPKDPFVAIQKYPSLRYIVDHFTEFDDQAAWEYDLNHLRNQVLHSGWLSISSTLALLLLVVTPIVRDSWKWVELFAERFAHANYTYVVGPALRADSLFVFGASVVWMLFKAAQWVVGRLLLNRRLSLIRLVIECVEYTFLLSMSLKLLVIPTLASVTFAFVLSPAYKRYCSKLYLSAMAIPTLSIWLVSIIMPIVLRKGWLFDCEANYSAEIAAQLVTTVDIAPESILRCSCLGRGASLIQHFIGKMTFWGLIKSWDGVVLFYKESEYRLTPEWVAAGLAHEIGHLARNHGILLAAFLSDAIIVAIVIAFRLFRSPRLVPIMFNFRMHPNLVDKDRESASSLSALSICGSIMLLSLVKWYIWRPLSWTLHWYLELDADRYAAAHGFSAELIDFLSVCEFYGRQHGLFSQAFYYVLKSHTHPPFSTRVAKLESFTI